MVAPVLVDEPTLRKRREIADGNPDKIPRWYRPGIGHPPLFLPPFHNGNGHQPTLRGRDRRASCSARYGKRKRSIDSGVPFGKGTGLFWGAVSVRDGTSRRGDQQSSRGIALKRKGL